MAHKLIHRQLPQEVRFPNRPTAERYATSVGGGLANWTIIVVGGSPGPTIDQLYEQARRVPCQHQSRPG